MSLVFELDMTEVDPLPAWWIEHLIPLKIRLKPGHFFNDSDFHIVDPRLEAYNVLTQISHLVNNDHDIPVAVNFRAIPVGALIRRMPDDDAPADD